MATTPEPFPGYDQATVEDVLDEIQLATEGPEREDLKARIRVYESDRDGGARKTVLEATSPASAPTTTAPTPEQALEQDTSGRPALAQIATARAADSHVRVIDPQEEN